MFDRHGLVVAAGVCAALIGGFFYLFIGSSVSPEQKTTAREPQRVAMPQPPKSHSKAPGAQAKPVTVAAAPQERESKATLPKGVSEEIVAKLEQQGVTRENALRLKTEQRTIADDVFEYLSKASNWMPELHKAAGSVMVGKNGEPSMLRVDDVAADSILRGFGIQDGDVVALINGEVPIFSPAKAVEYTRKAYSLINDLQEGRPVSITVLRNGKPLDLVYRK